MQRDIWDANGSIPMLGPPPMRLGAPPIRLSSMADLDEPVDPTAVRSISRLSPREREVLQELVDGKSHESAADDLFISHHTFRTHVKNILTKLGAHSSIEAVSIAVCAGVRPSRMLEITADEDHREGP